MGRDFIKDCLYHCEKATGGFECILDRLHCRRPRNVPEKGFRDTGICIYYIESHPVNADGTEIKEE